MRVCLSDQIPIADQSPAYLSKGKFPMLITIQPFCFCLGHQCVGESAVKCDKGPL